MNSISCVCTNTRVCVCVYFVLYKSFTKCYTELMASGTFRDRHKLGTLYTLNTQNNMNDFWYVKVIIRLPNPSSVIITDSFLPPEFKFMFPISRSLADHFHVIFASLSFWMTHLFMSCSVISAEQATSIHLWSEQEVFITGQSQRTREHIVSPSSLFWRISSNDPLNEPLLYSSWLSWGEKYWAWMGGTQHA